MASKRKGGLVWGAQHFSNRGKGEKHRGVNHSTHAKEKFAVRGSPHRSGGKGKKTGPMRKKKAMPALGRKGAGAFDVGKGLGRERVK